MTHELMLHELLSEHAVLQRDRPIAVYGTTEPGATVEIDLAGQQTTARALGDGTWAATLPPRSAGGPLTLVVTCNGTRLERRNLLVGDVWVASGQSNMEWPLSDCAGADEAEATAGDGGLRLFTVPRRTAKAPADRAGGVWTECSPASAGNFSGVAYYFARRVREAGVPIGVIAAAWGGTRIASWLPGDAIEPGDESPNAADDPTTEPANEPYVDPGNVGEAMGYADPAHDTSAWQTLRVPGMWQGQGHKFNGSVWLRRTVDIPAAWAGQALVLELGAVDDFDVTYWDGKRIGSIGPDITNAYAKKRVYRIDGAAARPGRSVIAVRIFDQWGDGGIVGPAPRLRRAAGQEDAILLAGEWRMKVEKAMLPWRTFAQSIGTSELYNAMLHPLRHSGVRGFLWYQGESDASRAERYRVLFARQIERWRSLFREPRAPFLFVQLAGHGEIPEAPVEHDWAELRDAQTAALALADTGMAVALDVGDPHDIHPRDKASVGERLARWALARVYGRTDLETSGPLFRLCTIKGRAVRIEFDHARGLSVRGGGKPLGFQVAGADRVFLWAEAAIEGESVLVSHPAIASPVAVRYGWSGSSRANLENSDGLPASPFRSDDWPGLTAGIR